MCAAVPSLLCGWLLTAAGGCRDFKVHILDVSALVESLGGPACVAEEAVVADSSNGVVYIQEGPHKAGQDTWQNKVDTHHSYGTHSAPWHLMEARLALCAACWDCWQGAQWRLCVQALKVSDCVTEDIDAAQAVFVDDYCYYVSWLGTGHLLGNKAFMNITDTPGDHIVKVR